MHYDVSNKVPSREELNEGERALLEEDCREKSFTRREYRRCNET
jgi:hypothetical protein